MDFNLVIAAIGSLGFPIVACVGMAIFFREVNNNYRTDLKEANNNHKIEIDKLTEAINNNTLVITKLIDRMDKNDND
jgi:hypothetical protein